MRDSVDGIPVESVSCESLSENGRKSHYVEGIRLYILSKWRNRAKLGNHYSRALVV